VNDLKFNWIGTGMHYGANTKFFSLNAYGIDLVFSIHKNPTFSEGDCTFLIHREPKKDLGTINKERVVNETITDVFLIITDSEFRKKTRHSYYIVKFITESAVITVGAYSDSPYEMTPDTCYLLCTDDFINFIANLNRVSDKEPLLDTGFRSLLCVFDKNELTKELLRD
jgi:hypothetical protein